MFIIGWIALSFAAALYAGRLKRGTGNWFLVSILFSPLVAFVFLVSLGESKDSNAELPKTGFGYDDVSSGPSSQISTTDADNKREDDRNSGKIFLNSVSNSYNLKAKGLITEDEFTHAKARAIVKILSLKNKPELHDFLGEILPLLEMGAISKEDIEEIKSKYYLYTAA